MDFKKIIGFIIAVVSLLITSQNVGAVITLENGVLIMTEQNDFNSIDSYRTGGEVITGIRVTVSITEIPKDGFIHWNLEFLSIHDGVTHFNNNSFEFCTIGVINIPKSLIMTSGNKFFNECTLGRVILPWEYVEDVPTSRNANWWGGRTTVGVMEIPSTKIVDGEEVPLTDEEQAALAQKYKTTMPWNSFGGGDEDFTTDVTTDVDDIETDDAQIKVLGDVVEITDGTWAIFSIDGRKVANGTGAASVELNAGIYIVKAGTQATKVLVK